MQIGLTVSEKNSEKNMIYHTFIQILRKKEDITGLYSYPKSMGFTDRIIADVYILRQKQKEEMQVEQNRLYLLFFWKFYFYK